MKLEKRRIGNKEVFPFTIPSGIITTEPSCLERIARGIPEIGIITTKSIGPEPKPGNREPILAQYAPHCWTNAVGLTNPGAEEFARRLNNVLIHSEKFLLISIFGQNPEEFAQVAKTLEAHADGFELNLSCPHAKGYGMELGESGMVREIVSAVKKITKKPIFAKLTPNTKDIGEIAEAAMNAGAYGITAINTVGPGLHMVDGHYVLTNKVGGISGKAITPIGIRCVKEITDRLGKIPMIVCGGIYTARDVEAYEKVRASFFGIGTALAGMSELDLMKFFPAIVRDIRNNTNEAEKLIKLVDMEYKKFRVAERIDLASNLHVLRMESNFDASAGQFVFAWLPEKGEKPFSVMGTFPLSIGFLERGCFTRELAKLGRGDEIYFKGPYGKPVPVRQDSILVGGGCGIFGLNLIARDISQYLQKVIILLGAKDKQHLPDLKEFERYGEVHVATEDGSFGKKGMVTDLLSDLNLKRDSYFSNYFFNCGPAQMIEAVLPLERRVSPPENIWSSEDRMTRCGVGICGSCANENGLRTCVEGPFMNP